MTDQRETTRLPILFLLAGTCAVLMAGPAQAHSDAAGAGLMSGLLHPVKGLDHVVAMVAVGLWGGILGGKAVWQLPVIFPMVMALAGALAVMGMPLPAVETGIALSGVVLGAMVLFALRPPAVVVAVLVGAFALFHGHAHGTELPDAANPAAYALGFVISTGALHLVGILIGQLWTHRWGKPVVRAVGGAILLTGGGFLTGLL